MTQPDGARLDLVHEGRAWIFGDSVDTNQLAGGGLAAATPEEELRINCLRGLRPEFTANVQSGDILVAGTNFGCGSSRHIAVEALELCGVAAVLAESVARIHWRNSIARAFLTLIVPGVTAKVQDGDTLEIDYGSRVVRNVTHGTELSIEPLSGSVEDIYRAGGLLNVITVRLTAAGYPPPGTS